MNSNEQARAGLAPDHKRVFLKGLSIGLGVMTIQLVLLLDAFDLYVQGKGGRIWPLALVGGLLFAGGLVILWMLYSPQALRPQMPSRMPAALHKSRTSPRHAA